MRTLQEYYENIIFIVIFWNFFWRCGNVQASRGYILFTRSLKKGYVALSVFFWSFKQLQVHQKNFQIFIFIFSCKIDPYLHGKLWFIQCWLWGEQYEELLFFRQLWHLIEKITYDVCFWTQFSRFSKKQFDVDQVAYYNIVTIRIEFF
jgi:hypothetical protein